ncbi:MAG: flavodoxin [Muribaculaceae bacterium]|nr:flavodoxin [Muribaculaceae bacterium]
MKRILLSLALIFSTITMQAKTLVVYYSYTNNVHNIVTELTKLIDADVVRIEPMEKGLDYAANNYAIGSALISAIRNNPYDAASYPAIDPVNVNLADYDCIIIGAPLWWSNMAAPLQTYLFHNGAAMAGKKIGLIVSSASSGISGVEGDAKRLIPDGDFLSPSLWIRSSQTSNASSMLNSWLKTIGYYAMTGVEDISADQNIGKYTIFSVSGAMVAKDALSLQNLEKGLYIVNGEKIYLK